MAVHTEGMVRVAHPGHGMGVEFPSRTPEQRAQVGNLISFPPRLSRIDAGNERFSARLDCGLEPV
jgi:hypothetical protein